MGRSRRASQRRGVLIPMGLLVATVFACRGKPGLAPELERELRAAKAATVPGDAEAVEESDVEATGTGLRATWRFRHKRDAPTILGSTERQLGDDGYRCSRDARVLRCSKLLTGDHLDVLVTAPTPDGAGYAWNVELTGRPD
jgi:hypothetical protein